ncbi:hypothetical protein SDC9_141348 [bioreactor metagenome]|uniref:Uncharacterized protein n=1 Tax=bioreactor metagenome TaxID=1076179 RepID=A0A645E017_9ZZZZ
MAVDRRGARRLGDAGDFLLFARRSVFLWVGHGDYRRSDVAHQWFFDGADQDFDGHGHIDDDSAVDRTAADHRTLPLRPGKFSGNPGESGARGGPDGE